MTDGTPILEVRDLNVYYGHSHALQGVNLTLGSGVMSVVGRNGMGKTTLCKTIMGLEPASSGSIAFAGQSLIGRGPADIARMGIGYVPQGRRLWPSLTVDEHLKLVEKRGGAWSVERVYATFPRLAERRGNNGGQLSGGEQQMLAISRALLLNPRLLVMDEPTEGLAPVIVQQVEDMLIQLGREGDIDVLVIEQNIGVACAVARDVAIMVNGRINRVMDSARLASDRDLQQALLGVGRHAHDETPEPSATTGSSNQPAEAHSQVARIYISNPEIPTRWSRAVPVHVIEGNARTVTSTPEPVATAIEAPRSLSTNRAGTVLVAGTLDTKGDELRYMRDLIKVAGLPVKLVDLSTSGKPSGAEIPPHTIANHHPRGSAGVFTSDRGSAVAGMSVAFERWIQAQNDVAGVISAGGSGGTALVAPAMRRLPMGYPKLIVSTVASGQVGQYVGASDITLMNAVADVQGLNSITREVLGNAAQALVGMVKARRESKPITSDKPAIGITMFGVTTPAVQQISARLEADHDVLVFHATGTGGQAMESLLDENRLTAVIDLTTTEVCDMIAGGVFPCDETRFDASIRAGLPFVGSCGALDMVNFNAPDTVPERYQGRNLYHHNPQITLMRTTPEDCAAIGTWIGEKLNQMSGPVRFFLPEGGVSALDAPGQPFHDPAANAALFHALETTVRQSTNRQLIRTPHHINDPQFAHLVLEAFAQLNGGQSRAMGG